MAVAETCINCGQQDFDDLGNGFHQCVYCRTKIKNNNYNENIKTNLNKAMGYRRGADFERARITYQNLILNEPDCFEAYWGYFLSKYEVNIEQNKNGDTVILFKGELLFNDIYDDHDYTFAIEHAPEELYTEYEEIAEEIQNERDRILEKESQIVDYDVFICHKEFAEETGERTIDSIVAERLYKNLTADGYKVFFGPMEKKKHDVSEYGAVAYNSLKKSEVLLLISSNKEYLEGTFIKNIWANFIKMTETDRTKFVLPVISGFEGRELPGQLKKYRNQALDINMHGDLAIIESVKRLAPLGFNVNGNNIDLQALRNDPNKLNTIQGMVGNQNSGFTPAGGGLSEKLISAVNYCENFFHSKNFKWSSKNVRTEGEYDLDDLNKFFKFGVSKPQSRLLLETSVGRIDKERFLLYPDRVILAVPKMGKIQIDMFEITDVEFTAKFNKSEIYFRLRGGQGFTIKTPMNEIDLVNLQMIIKEFIKIFVSSTTGINIPSDYSIDNIY